jgi:Fe-S oxidoreductase
LRSIGEQVLALTLSLGGSMSSEHGDGIVAGEWIEKTYGAEITEAMRSIKRAADPDNILNPAKMLDAPPMDSHLRYGETYRAQTWIPALSFNHTRGLAGAIEHCNGQGVCRKTTGTMCPSFQATRDEGNSTRGRANLLRALITEQGTRKAEFTQPAFNALDLCLACKGCTSECPSGVDMPKLKYEFMNHYYKTHRRQLRDYLFGYFHVVSKFLSPVAPFANAFMKMDWSRKLIARVTGITDKRPFPVFSTRRSRFQRDKTFGKRVIFLSDVFSRYLEPDVEQAAFSILRAAGYDPLILPMIGAGTSLLSKGFIEAARKHAEKVLDTINALDPESALSVVGCEPPEVYCLKHEYAALLPDRRAEIESIKSRVWVLDEFILRVVNKGVENNNLSESLIKIRLIGNCRDRPAYLAVRRKSDWQSDLHLAVRHGKSQRTIKISEQPARRKITFHPHCHQRAEGLSDDGLPTGAAATVELLRVFGFDVDVIDSGCCGMAGTFGYDAEHYDLSMQVGELKLLPQIRKLGIENGALY